MASPPVLNPAKAYERFQAQINFVLTKDLIQRADPKNGDRVLDLACGTGMVARSVAEMVGPQGEIMGLDISPSKLEVASTLASKVVRRFPSPTPLSTLCSASKGSNSSQTIKPV